MKKIFCIIITAVMCLIGASCGKESVLQSKLTDFRNSLFCGETDEYSVVAQSGYKESPFINDGEKGTLSDVFLLKVKPLNDDFVSVYSAEVDFNGKKLRLNLEYNLLSNKFTADFKTNYDGESVKVTIFRNGESAEIILENKSKNAINYKKALKTAESEFNELMVTFANTNQNYEIYLRLLKEGEKCYWYCGFAMGKNKIYAILIDGTTGGVIARKEIGI